MRVMSEEYHLHDSIVVATVKDVRGKCRFGNKIGDKIIFDGKTIRGRICYGAAQNLIPKVYVYFLNPERFKRYFQEVAKVSLPLPDIMTIGCPDNSFPGGVVLFEIKQIRKKGRFE